MLKRAGIGEPVSLIALQKPYMERRTLATLQAQWPEARVAVSSPPVTFRGYLTAELPQELVVSAMVGTSRESWNTRGRDSPRSNL